MEMKGQMDVQEAVQAAKEYINKTFENENISPGPPDAEAFERLFCNHS